MDRATLRGECRSAARERSGREDISDFGPRAAPRRSAFAIPIWPGRCGKSRRAGATHFIDGEITKRILALSARHGGALAAKDFADYSSEWAEPISTTYRGWTVYEMPPNVQGIGALEMLNLMEQFDLHSYGLNSARALHVQIEAKKLAYADVLRYIADPKMAKLPVSGMLSKAIRRRAREVDRHGPRELRRRARARPCRPRAIRPT